MITSVVDDFCLTLLFFTGVKQTLNPRLTLQDNGDLSIKNVTYGNIGGFICIVKNARFAAYVIHNLIIECESCVVFHLV